MDATILAMWRLEDGHMEALQDLISFSACEVSHYSRRGPEVRKHCWVTFLGFQVTVFSKNTPIFPFTDSFGTIVLAMF